MIRYKQEGLSFQDIALREPRLEELRQRCLLWAGGEDFAHEYERAKSTLTLLVGWRSDHPDPLLHTSQAYEVAIGAVVDALERRPRRHPAHGYRGPHLRQGVRP